MKQPSKTLLLAVTGATPQVVTETLYGIHQQGLEWPDEIQVITTSYGKEQVHNGLLKSEVLKTFCDEYNKPVPHFNEQLIKVIPDANGNPVADARTLEDQEALADFIVAQVKELTSDDSIRIHASIAGGRKTMTFFLGYAMSIFAREFDRLSHVLVSEKFEDNPQFYYPTTTPKIITNKHNDTLDCSQAEVMLAEIPLISQRMLEPKMVDDFKHFSYNDIVNAIQLKYRQQHLSLTLVMAKADPHILFGQKRIEFNGRKTEFAMLAAFARAKAKGEKGFNRQASRLNEANFTHAFLQELCVLEELSFTPHKLEQVLEDLRFAGAVDGKTLGIIEDKSELNNTNFSDMRNRLKAHLNKFLPMAAVNLIIPQTKGQHQPYNIEVPASNISFVEKA